MQTNTLKSTPSLFRNCGTYIGKQEVERCVHTHTQQREICTRDLYPHAPNDVVVVHSFILNWKKKKIFSTTAATGSCSYTRGRQHEALRSFEYISMFVYRKCGRALCIEEILCVTFNQKKCTPLVLLFCSWSWIFYFINTHLILISARAWSDVIYLSDKFFLLSPCSCRAHQRFRNFPAQVIFIK